jgi:hypothetical protein
MVLTKWQALALACAVSFGAYYSFETPSVLHNEMYRHYNFEDRATFELYFSLIYSLYAFPNLVLPLIGGMMADQFGNNKVMLLFSTFVLAGSIIETVACSMQRMDLFLFGRFIFGCGAETLNVCGSIIITRWFNGQELALAMAINLSVSKLATVISDWVSPQINAAYGIEANSHFVTFLCFVCYILTMLLVAWDKGASKPHLTVLSALRQSEGERLSSIQLHQRQLAEREECDPLLHDVLLRRWESAGAGAEAGANAEVRGDFRRKESFRSNASARSLNSLQHSQGMSSFTESEVAAGERDGDGDGDGEGVGGTGSNLSDRSSPFGGVVFSPDRLGDRLGDGVDIEVGQGGGGGDVGVPANNDKREQCAAASSLEQRLDAKLKQDQNQPAKTDSSHRPELYYLHKSTETTPLLSNSDHLQNNRNNTGCGASEIMQMDDEFNGSLDGQDFYILESDLQQHNSAMRGAKVGGLQSQSQPQYSRLSSLAYHENEHRKELLEAGAVVVGEPARYMGFSVTAWLLFLLTFVMYGTFIPFTNWSNVIILHYYFRNTHPTPVFIKASEIAAARYYSNACISFLVMFNVSIWLLQASKYSELFIGVTDTLFRGQCGFLWSTHRAADCVEPAAGAGPLGDLLRAFGSRGAAAADRAGLQVG